MLFFGLEFAEDETEEIDGISAYWTIRCRGHPLDSKINHFDQGLLAAQKRTQANIAVNASGGVQRLAFF